MLRSSSVLSDNRLVLRVKHQVVESILFYSCFETVWDAVHAVVCVVLSMFVQLL